MEQKVMERFGYTKFAKGIDSNKTNKSQYQSNRKNHYRLPLRFDNQLELSLKQKPQEEKNRSI